MVANSKTALRTVLPLAGLSKPSMPMQTLVRWSLLVVGLVALLFMQSVRADVAIRVQAQPLADPIRAFVTVTDANGDPIGGLTAADFTVSLDGAPLSTSPTFSLPPGTTGATQKVSVVFAMDYSFSVTSVARAAMEQAVTDFINSMQSGDYAAIVKFNNSNPNKASVVRAFTQIDDGGPGDQALIQAVASDYPGQGTNLFDAVVTSIGEFNSPLVTLPTGPRAIILVSDGGENDSSVDVNTAVAAAVDANVSIFTVGVGDFSSATSQQILNNLADETNGDFYPAPNSTQIADAYVQISQLLNNEYLLSFASTITDCNTHTLEVLVTGQSAVTANFKRCTNLLAPDVRGLTQAAATTALVSAGLVVGTVTQQSSSTVASGSVISQSPVVGTVVNPGSSVNLVVSSGPPPVAVPNVVGQTQAAATTTLTGAGLVVGTVTQQSSSTVASGSVISQNPAAGSQAAAGSSVSLVVSSGPPPVAVPNVVGQTQAAATTTLTGAGLVVGTVTQQSSSTVASGSVISQNPAAGSQAAAGSSVSLVVSSGPAKKSGGGGGGATGPVDALAGLLLAGLLWRRRRA